MNERWLGSMNKCPNGVQDFQFLEVFIMELFHYLFFLIAHILGLNEFTKDKI